MSQFLYLSSLAVFLALPPTLLGIRLARRTRMPWWLLILLIAGLGWFLINCTVHFHYSHLGEVLASYGEHPPDGLLQQWSDDGAKRVFALFFGWLYALVYLAPWLVLYGALQGGLRLLAVARRGIPPDAGTNATEP